MNDSTLLARYYSLIAQDLEASYHATAAMAQAHFVQGHHELADQWQRTANQYKQQSEHLYEQILIYFQEGTA